MKTNHLKCWFLLLGMLFLINKVALIKLNSKSVLAEINSTNITKNNTNDTNTEKNLRKQDTIIDNYTLMARVEPSLKTNEIKENNQIYVIEDKTIKVNVEGLSELEINLIKKYFKFYNSLAY